MLKSSLGLLLWLGIDMLQLFWILKGGGSKEPWGNLGEPWGTMGNLGEPRKTMGNLGERWGTMGSHGEYYLEAHI